MLFSSLLLFQLTNRYTIACVCVLDSLLPSNHFFLYFLLCFFSSSKLKLRLVLQSCGLAFIISLFAIDLFFFKQWYFLIYILSCIIMFKSTFFSFSCQKMGGDHHHHNVLKVPDWKMYKVENSPELLRIKAALAQKGLSDPWLR